MAVVLVIDDDPTVRNLLKMGIEKEGHTVLPAADTSVAWQLLQKNPEALFVDIDLPGETGIEFVLRLREHPVCGHLPVVFVTAHRDRARPLIASGAEGIVDVIDKPFHLKTILKRLDQMLDYQKPE